ncbi:MAG TPA: ABC transporter permease, partial [Clostridia bacterium]|nr:ABC transporter permease [Clostridia bacterium]
NSNLMTETAVNGTNSTDKTLDSGNEEIKSKVKKRSSMSIFTALSLSARNLVTKKFRTILTTIAGSIGIIGIALVLAISNGFSIFMTELERTTLSSFPLSISALSFELGPEIYSASLNENEVGAYPDEAVVIPSEPNESFGAISFHPNYLTESYVSYVKKMETEHPDWLASVAYTRTLKMHLLTNKGTEETPNYSKVDTTSLTATWWQELLNKDFLLDEYNLLAGKFPSNSHELVLIVNNKNELTKSTLETLGYNPKLNPNTKEYMPFSFSDFIGGNGVGGKTFKLISNNAYYLPNGTSTEGIPLFDELESSGFANAYEESTNELSIVGILRIKEDGDLPLLYSGIGYLPSLTEEVLADCAMSEIVKTQKSTYVDVLSNGIDKFEFDFTAVDAYLAQMEGFDISGLPDYYFYNFGFINAEGYNRLKSNPFGFGDLYDAIAEYDALLDDETTPIDKMLSPLKDMVDLNMLKSFLNAEYTTCLKNIGADTIPTTISIYPKSFEYKSSIKKYLDDYNTMMSSELDHIKYTDIAATISASVSEMVNIATYVLIAFAAISLIVSSIMIAIITYISVLERTKEIGVLRSLGARKIDVSNVFNAETLIIGCISGILGVIVASLLTIPINNLITSYTGPMVQNLAKLNPLHGFLLVILSMVLTVVSGLIPATIAAKKDPVVALRE